MIEFWLDSDSLIQARNGPYGFDIAPGFWTTLNDQIELGRVGSSRYIYQEIMAGNQDDLTAWIGQHRNSTMYTEPDHDVQSAMGQIADLVNLHPLFQQRWKNLFLSKADPWIIAHAKASGGRVVTFESLAGANTTKVKIPNVCNAVGVGSMTLFDMLRALGVSLA